VSREEAVRRVEEEIVREKSAVLGRAGERLERLLAEVAALGQRLDAVRRAGGDLAAPQHAYEEAWRRARQARQVLLIQREAIGLRCHAVVDQQFPEPPRRLVAGGGRGPLDSNCAAAPRTATAAPEMSVPDRYSDGRPGAGAVPRDAWGSGAGQPPRDKGEERYGV
jgi:hypothetical protein